MSRPDSAAALGPTFTATRDYSIVKSPELLKRIKDLYMNSCGMRDGNSLNASQKQALDLYTANHYKGRCIAKEMDPSFFWSNSWNGSDRSRAGGRAGGTQGEYGIPAEPTHLESLVKFSDNTGVEKLYEANYLTFSGEACPYIVGQSPINLEGENLDYKNSYYYGFWKTCFDNDVGVIVGMAPMKLSGNLYAYSIPPGETFSYNGVTVKCEEDTSIDCIPSKTAKRRKYKITHDDKTKIIYQLVPLYIPSALDYDESATIENILKYTKIARDLNLTVSDPETAPKKKFFHCHAGKDRSVSGAIWDEIVQQVITRVANGVVVEDVDIMAYAESAENQTIEGAGIDAFKSNIFSHFIKSRTLSDILSEYLKVFTYAFGSESAAKIIMAAEGAMNFSNPSIPVAALQTKKESQAKDLLKELFQQILYNKPLTKIAIPRDADSERREAFNRSVDVLDFLINNLDLNTAKKALFKKFSEDVVSAVTHVFADKIAAARAPGGVGVGAAAIGSAMAAAGGGAGAGMGEGTSAAAVVRGDPVASLTGGTGGSVGSLLTADPLTSVSVAASAPAPAGARSRSTVTAAPALELHSPSRAAERLRSAVASASVTGTQTTSTATLASASTPPRALSHAPTPTQPAASGGGIARVTAPASASVSGAPTQRRTASDTAADITLSSTTSHTHTLEEQTKAALSDANQFAGAALGIVAGTISTVDLEAINSALKSPYPASTPEVSTRGGEALDLVDILGDPSMLAYEQTAVGLGNLEQVPREAAIQRELKPSVPSVSRNPLTVPAPLPTADCAAVSNIALSHNIKGLTEKEATSPFSMAPFRDLTAVATVGTGAGAASGAGGPSSSIECPSGVLAANPTKLTQVQVTTNYPKILPQSNQIWTSDRTDISSSIRERGNKVNALSDVYLNQQSINGALIAAVIQSAEDVNIDIYNNATAFGFIKKTIDLARQMGGINNVVNQISGDYEKSTLIDSTDDKEAMKRFSGTFQRNCEKLGLYSGRLGGRGGLRLTFIPDEVFNDLCSTKIIEKKDKDFFAKIFTEKTAHVAQIITQAQKKPLIRT